MPSSPERAAIGRLYRGWSRQLTWLVMGGCAVFTTAGCESQPREPAPKSIIGQRTQEVRSAEREVAKGDAKVITPKITAKDPILLVGNAYVSTIGRTSVMQIQHALDLYHAEKDRYPKDLDEFMTDIIKANNIGLPKLPDYQKYGYDEKEHKLVILEYPALKDQPVQ